MLSTIEQSRISPRKRNIFQKYFGVLHRGLGNIDSCKKNRHQKSHASVPLNDVTERVRSSQRKINYSALLQFSCGVSHNVVVYSVSDNVEDYSVVYPTTLFSSISLIGIEFIKEIKTPSKRGLGNSWG